jgi:hypothetical protein
VILRRESRKPYFVREESKRIFMQEGKPEQAYLQGVNTYLPYKKI